MKLIMVDREEREDILVCIHYNAMNETEAEGHSG